MMDVSPREAWLERQYSKLKAEVEYLRKENPIKWDFNEPPEMMAVSKLSDTLEVAQVGVMERDHKGLHVLCFEKQRLSEPVRMAYYLDPTAFESINKEYRAKMMMHMHEKMIFELGHKMWGG